MAQTERLELRTSTDFLAVVDEWRRLQSDLPGRSEAIRRLCLKGLAADGVNIPENLGDER